MIATQDQLWRATAHESGHAGVVILRGFEVGRVLVRSDGSGRCFGDERQSDLDVLEMAVAGHVAERVLCGPGGWVSAPDLDQAYQCAERRVGERYARGEVRRVEAVVHELVTKNAQAILALARELHRARELTGEQARRIVRAWTPFLRTEPVYVVSRRYVPPVAPPSPAPQPTSPTSPTSPWASVGAELQLHVRRNGRLPRDHGEMSPDLRSALTRASVLGMAAGIGPGRRAGREYR